MLSQYKLQCCGDAVSLWSEQLQCPITNRFPIKMCVGPVQHPHSSMSPLLTTCLCVNIWRTLLIGCLDLTVLQTLLGRPGVLTSTKVYSPEPFWHFFIFSCLSLRENDTIHDLLTSGQSLLALPLQSTNNHTCSLAKHTERETFSGITSLL